MNYPDQMKAVWIASVSNMDFPSRSGLSGAELKNELDSILDTVSACGLNTVFFQVRPASDALYRSELFPVSEYLCGEQSGTLPDGFDPFGYLLSEGHRRNISVHAWINPLRVTLGSAEHPKTDPHMLHPKNPAFRHPEWTVAYSDGKLYYNAGLEQVRHLVREGVKEVLDTYPECDGIVFDDYFYPYPGPGGPFHDEEAYLADPRGMELADWRRDNINRIVKDCYEETKLHGTEKLFGISPFGIWRNDDGKNGGSATNGLNAADAIFCDALAWIEGGYVDYISPQLYWRFSFEIARFDVLCEWWAAHTENTSVRFYPCHGVYRISKWASEDEIERQIRFAKRFSSFGGCVFFGYGELKSNGMDVRGQINRGFLF